MPLDTLDQITHPDKNLASPRDISDGLKRLSTIGFHLQGQSLVVQQQLTLSALEDPTHIASYAGYAQTNVKKYADYYLNRILPGLISVVTSADSINNIVQAFATASMDPDVANDPRRIEKLCQLVYQNIDDVHQKSLRLYQETRSTADVAVKNMSMLKGALKKTIEGLDNDDGQLAAAMTAISETEAAIQKNIQEIIDNANVVGEGLKDLFTSIITTISGNSKKDDPEKPAEGKGEKGDKDDDGDESASDPKAGEETPELKSFPVESISTTSSGIKGISDARNAMDKNFQKLGVLYQDLAELNTILSASKVISEQTTSFSVLYDDLAVSIIDYTNTLGIVSGNFKALAAELNNVNADDVEFIHIKTKIRVASKSWTQVAETTREIESAMSGVTKYFRPQSIN